MALRDESFYFRLGYYCMRCETVLREEPALHEPLCKVIKSPTKYRTYMYLGHYCMVCEQTFKNEPEVHRRAHIAVDGLPVIPCPYERPGDATANPSGTSRDSENAIKRLDSLTFIDDIPHPVENPTGGSTVYATPPATPRSSIGDGDAASNEAQNPTEDSMASETPPASPRSPNDKSTCTDCGKELSSPSALKVHKRTHTGEKPFRCEECWKCFSQKGDLNKHLKTHAGTPDEIYRCGTCGVLFSQKAKRDKHPRCHGEGAPKREEPALHEPCKVIKSPTKYSTYMYLGHYCMVCEQTFKNEPEVHRRAHLAVDGLPVIPYPYERPGDATANPSGTSPDSENAIKRLESLTIIDDIPHPVENPTGGSTVYATPPATPRSSIGDGDAASNEAQNPTGGSMASETPPASPRSPNDKSTCTDCGKELSSPSALKVHKRTHTGEKPFRCEECWKCFSQKGDLNKHLKTHAGTPDEMYRCGTCGVLFSQKAKLDNHPRCHGEGAPKQ